MKKLIQAGAVVSLLMSEVAVRGALTFVLQGLVVFLMWRKNLLRRFPIFFGYVLYQMVEGLVRWAVESSQGVGSRHYFYVYWSTEVCEIVLLFLALSESCWHLFGRLRKVDWFWRAFLGTVGGTVTYAIVAAWSDHPKGVSWGLALITRLDLVATYVPVGVGILYFWIIFRFKIGGFAREGAIVSGLAITSGAGIVALALRWYLGVRAFQATAWVVPWGYILAQIVWIQEFLRPEAEGVSQEERQLIRRRMRDLAEAIDGFMDRFTKGTNRE